jgi:hypothetical protein
LVHFGTGQTSGNQRRILTLTNNQVIWDLAGNVYSWTDDLITNKDLPDVFNYSDDSENNDGLLPDPFWSSYAKDSSYTWYLKYDDLGVTTLKYKDLYLLSSGNYTSVNGVGAVYRTVSDRSSTDTSTTRVFARGGYWRSGPYAGVLALNLNSTPTNRTARNGFRCVVVPQ